MSNAMQGWFGDRGIDQDLSRSMQCQMLCRGGLEIEGLAKIIPGLSRVQCCCQMLCRGGLEKGVAKIIPGLGSVKCYA